MTTDVATTRQPDDTLDRILRDLATEEWELPEDAIREARQHRDEIIPRLIQAIEDATARAAAGDVPDDETHFYALFLLTEFQAKEALPAILAAISLPGELPFDLFGDAITEVLPRVLAALACDIPEFLEALVQNRSLNEYVRWAAAETFFFLVRDGCLTRENAVERLRHHLREAIDNREADAGEALVLELLSYSPAEALPEIEEAFQLDLIDPDMIDFDEVNRCISEGDLGFRTALENCRPTGIEDAIAELKTWNAFSDDAGWDTVPAFDEEPWDEEEDWPEANFPPPPATIRNTGPRVGRNDPCPCGSGKKFKKCCGGSAKD